MPQHTQRNGIEKENVMSMLTRLESPSRDLQGEMRRLQHEMDQLLGRWGMRLPSWPVLAAAYPPVNVWDDNDNVHVEAELPGMKLADLEINVTATGELKLKGKREQTPTPKKAEWHRQERPFGAFDRTVMLPVDVDSSKVEARLENGVLTIQLAKRPEVKPRKIPVKAE
jgi:HSP20 family protein